MIKSVKWTRPFKILSKLRVHGNKTQFFRILALHLLHTLSWPTNIILQEFRIWYFCKQSQTHNFSNPKHTKNDIWHETWKQMPFHFFPFRVQILHQPFPQSLLRSTLYFTKQNRTFWVPAFENRMNNQERQAKVKWPNDLTNKTKSKSPDLKTSKDGHFCNQGVHQKTIR